MGEQYGYAGKVLKVDLTSRQITEILSDQYLPKYFGGRGLAARLYWDEITPEVGALDPDNALIFTTGPLTATGVGMTSVGMCAGKAPMIYPSPTYFCSSAAGAWAHEMKYAGCDAFVIKGQAEEPVYLWIEDGHVQIRNADFLWGHTTRQTRQELMERHGEKIQAACIGPAGERLVIPSIISVDSNTAFGQGGFGAVMGSKKLKAIAVRGTGSIRVADPGRIVEMNEAMRQLSSVREGETRILSSGKKVVGRYEPSKTPFFPVPDTETSAELGRGDVRIRRAACPGCFVMCKSKRQYVDGSIPGGSAECQDLLLWVGPEQLAYGGRLFGRLNWETSMLIDDLGLDNFHAGCMGYGYVTGNGFPVPWSNVSPGGASVVLDMWWEANRRGILTEENTGLPWSRFGSREFMLQYAHMLAYREGFGDIMARGSGVAVKYIMEHEEFGPNRNEMEWLYQKTYPKAGVFGGINRHHIVTGEGLGSPGAPYSLYSAVNVKRGKEPHAYMGFEPKEWLIKFYGTDKVADPSYWGDDLAKAIVRHEYYANQADCAPVCAFNMPTQGVNRYLVFKLNDLDNLIKYSLNGTAEYLSAVFGEAITTEMLFARDEMLVNLERAIWIRDGYTNGAVDTYFDCIFEETDIQGQILIPKDKFEVALDTYYQLRGWKNGVPTRSKLDALGLQDVAYELEKRGAPMR